MRALLVLLVLAIIIFFCRPALADFWDGVDAYNRGDYKTALREFKPLAEEGGVEAQYNLGIMYNQGFGVPQDYEEAAKWYSLAAWLGHAKAQYNLGVMYYRGQGIPKDYKEAVKWWKLSAEQGSAEAQSNLGAVYYNGQGVPQDYILAHMWYNLAASNGHKKGVEDRDDTAKLMTPEQIGQAQTMARECVAKDYQGC